MHPANRVDSGLPQDASVRLRMTSHAHVVCGDQRGGPDETRTRELCQGKATRMVRRRSPAFRRRLIQAFLSYVALVVVRRCSHQQLSNHSRSGLLRS
jgi:hypothetical protein